MTLEVRAGIEADDGPILALRRQAFNAIEVPSGLPPSRLEGFRVLVEDGRVVAVLRSQRVGQFFGGATVPMAAVSSVAVAPEARGRGLVQHLLRETLAEQRSAGLPLSVLYPSTVPTYRRAGYELAGMRLRFRAPARDAPATPGINVEPWHDDLLADVMDCYGRFAVTQNGLIDRPPDWWTDRVVATHKNPVHRYMARGAEGAIEGYIVFRQEPVGGALPYYHTISCRDLVWTAAAGARAMLSLVSAHRALATDLLWYGPPNDPIAQLFAEAVTRPDWSMPWMARLLDPAAALAARGYPAGTDECVELQIEDRVLGVNTRAFRLEVEGRRGRVTPLDGARLKVGVATLAAIYTGWLAPADALRLGRLDAKEPSAVSALERIFAGSLPWMIEMF